MVVRNRVSPRECVLSSVTEVTSSAFESFITLVLAPISFRCFWLLIGWLETSCIGLKTKRCRLFPLVTIVIQNFPFQSTALSYHASESVETVNDGQDLSLPSLVQVRRLKEGRRWHSIPAQNASSFSVIQETFQTVSIASLTFSLLQQTLRGC